MTVVNPKSISGINSITMASGGDDLLTIHSNNTTERVRVNNSGDVIVGSGVTLSPDGDVFATGVCTATSFSGSGANLTGVLSDIVEDTSPQLGGDLDTNGNNITFGDSGSGSDDRLKFGASSDFSIYHDGTNTQVYNNTGDLIIADGGGTLYLQSDVGIRLTDVNGNENFLRAYDNGAVELYHDGTKQCETSANGLAFPSGKGIDFSATGDGGGMSSELLDDYEEGTWTPTLNSGNSFSESEGRYVKIGTMVYAFWEITMPSTSASNHMIINNLPFTSTNAEPSCGGTAKDYQTYDIENGPIYHVPKNNTQIQFYKNSGQNFAESNGSGLNFRGCSIYQAAS